MIMQIQNAQMETAIYRHVLHSAKRVISPLQPHSKNSAFVLHAVVAGGLSLVTVGTAAILTCSVNQVIISDQPF